VAVEVAAGAVEAAGAAVVEPNRLEGAGVFTAVEPPNRLLVVPVAAGAVVVGAGAGADDEVAAALEAIGAEV
jgi:hypothetical protein